jgi:hypothetical protein
MGYFSSKSVEIVDKVTDCSVPRARRLRHTASVTSAVGSLIRSRVHLSSHEGSLFFVVFQASERQPALSLPPQLA